MYPVFDGLLADYEDAFTYGFVHIGGDEVHNLWAWGNSSVVQAFAKEKGIQTMDEMRDYYGELVCLCALRARYAVVSGCMVEYALLQCDSSLNLFE